MSMKYAKRKILCVFVKLRNCRHKPDKYKDVLKGLSFMTDYEWNSVGELRSFKPEAGYCVVSPFDVFRLIKSYFKF